MVGSTDLSVFTCFNVCSLFCSVLNMNIASHFLFVLLQSGTELQAVSGTLAETDANKFGNRVGISRLLV